MRDDIVPTRSAYLELLEDRRSMQDGYRFLDEKRLVLAGELIAELERYEQNQQSFRQAYAAAVAALRIALEHHGLEELQAYPAPTLPQATLEMSTRHVLGVELVSAHLTPGGTTSAAVFPSRQAQTCQQAFQDLLTPAAALGAQLASLQRLWQEYRRTAQRARALEDVLLPEIDDTLRAVDASLEDQEREEAIRVHYFKQLGGD